MKNIIVAIDGPAGAGKSTVAKLLAAQIGAALLDTGAMYRCVALVASQRGTVEPDSATAIAEKLHIDFRPGEPQAVLANGQDVTAAIRTLEIGQLASELSVHSSLRKVLVGKQQRLLETGSFVLEGRDTTTVVAPDADLKVFLTASIEERARRRWAEMGRERTLQEVVVDVVQRDHRDYSRQDSPLKLAEDAHIVESFGRTPESIVAELVSLLGQRR